MNPNAGRFILKVLIIINTDTKLLQVPERDLLQRLKCQAPFEHPEIREAGGEGISCGEVAKVEKVGIIAGGIAADGIGDVRPVRVARAKGVLGVESRLHRRLDIVREADICCPGTDVSFLIRN